MVPCSSWTCAEVVGTVYCSAHLETPRHGPDVAESQAVEYLELVREHRRGTGATVLAGDLNLSRAEADAVLEGRGYKAVSSGPTVSAHHSPARRQIDLIYVDDVDDGNDDSDDPVVPFRTASTHCDGQASDHCVVLAALDLSSSVR